MSSNALVGIFVNRSISEFAPRTEGNFTNKNTSETANGVLLFSPGIYYLIGTLMIIIMVTGFSTNLAILYTYATNRKIRTVDNTLIIGLALSDIGQAIFGIPFVAISSFSKQWIFGHAVCQYYAFITTCFGIAQISMLTVIAMERYFVIVKHDRRLTNTPCRCVIIILCSFIYGSSWATGPLLGWSGYKEEEIGIACCVKWEIKDGIAFSYTISICTFGWFIPLFLIAFGYISIACSIYNEHNKRMHVRRNVLPSKTNRERKVAITVLIMIGAFIISWTPYSAVSLWSAVGDFQSIPLWVQVAPAVFAKCSIIWNPLIYVARHKNFRKGVKESLSYLKLWDKKYNYDIRGRKSNYQQSTKRDKEIESTHVKSCVRQSITSDNFVTYMESPARSNSSVSMLFDGPSFLKHQRVRRYLTLFSKFKTSVHMEEGKSADSSSTGSVKNQVPCESKSIQTDKVIVYIPPGCIKERLDKYVQTDLSHSDLKKEDYTSGKDSVLKGNSGLEISDKKWATEMKNKTKGEFHGMTILSDAEIHSHENNTSNIITFNDIESKNVGRHSPAITNFDLNEECGINSVAGKDKPREGKKNKDGASLVDKTSRKIDIEKQRNLEVLKERRELLKQRLEIICHDSQSHVVSQNLRVRQGANQIRNYSLGSQTLSTVPTTAKSFIKKQNLMDKLNVERNDTPTSIDFRNLKQRRLITMSMSQQSINKVLKPSYVKKKEIYKKKLTNSRNMNYSNGFEMRTCVHKPLTSTLQLQKTEDDNVVNIYGAHVRFTDKYDRTTIIRQSTV